MNRPPFIVITLKRYLAGLDEYYKDLNSEIIVPTQKELSEATGIPTSTLSRMINNEGVSINRNHLAAIITEMRRRGFGTSLSDLIQYVGPLATSFKLTHYGTAQQIKRVEEKAPDCITAPNGK